MPATGWIQQTRQESRKSGGPQYYLQGIEDSTRTVLHAYGMCEVWLGTPYGIIESGLVAVASDKVLDGNKLRPGRVGHDRIQRRRADASIEGQIRHWYSLPDHQIVRVEFAELLYKRVLLLLPTRVRFATGRARALCYHSNPLTFTAHAQSPLLLEQIRACRDAAWVLAQLESVLRDHTNGKPHVAESDLLRSSGFDYQVLRRTQPERATVLCMDHDAPRVLTPVVDVLEIRALAAALGRHLEGRQ